MKSVMVMATQNLTDLPIKILIQLTCVMHVVDQVIQENIMNEDDYIRLAVKAEKELLIQCIKIPGYAAKRLQSHFGYTMLELQQLKEK